MKKAASMNFLSRVNSPPSELSDQGESYGPRGHETFGLRELWYMLLRRRRIILSFFIVAAAGIAAIGLLQTPKYRAGVVLMVNPGQEQVVNQDQALSETSPNSAIVESEIEVLRSPELVRQLIATLHLADDPRWNSAMRRDPVALALTTLRNQAGERQFGTARSQRSRARGGSSHLGQAARLELYFGRERCLARSRSGGCNGKRIGRALCGL